MIFGQLKLNRSAHQYVSVISMKCKIRSLFIIASSFIALLKYDLFVYLK